MSQGGAATARSKIDEGELHALVDGRLPDQRRGAILAHLLVESADRERVEAYRRQLAGLARIREGLGRYGEDFAPELQRALADALLRARRRRLALRGAAGLVAASLLGLVVLGAVQTWRADPPAATALLYEPELPVPEFPFGGKLGQAAAPRPSGDRERSLAWLAGHLRDQPLELPDLRDLGLVPVGAEVIESGSAPAVRLAWSDAAGRSVDLFVGVVSSDADQAFTMVGESLISLHWRRGRLVFALVGPGDSPELVEVMQAVVRGLARPDDPTPLPAGKAIGPKADPRPIPAAAEPIPAVSPSVAPLPEKAAPPLEGTPVKVATDKSKPL